jgi:ADP-ribose pyrophosphatase YjhB (NUDIX family)
MHYLQKAILDKLRFEQPLNYAALMPEGIESSHFRYHLKQLMKDKLVTQIAEGAGKGRYLLTDKGEQEVDYLSQNRTTTIRTPKVISYTLLIHRGKLLLYKKPKEPYRGLYGLIGGKIHFGEDAAVAAKREVSEKTGLAIDPPDFCGTADIIIAKHGEPLSHVTAYVFAAELDRLPEEMPAELAAIAKDELSGFDVLPDVPLLLDEIEAGQKAGKPFAAVLRCSID